MSSPRTLVPLLARMAAAVALLGGLMLAPRAALAEDIDVFATVNSANDLPNVLIVWDSSANWGATLPIADCSFSDGSGGPKASSPGKEQGSKFGMEKCAIYNVIHALPTADDGSALFNVGLMLFNESDAPQAGYPRRQFLPLTAANKTLLKDTIRAITIGNDKANNGPFAMTLNEAYLMFARATPYRGMLEAKADPSAVLGGKYVGPPGSGCGKNHIIFLANGSPSENNTNAGDVLKNAGGNVTPLVYPSSLITNSDQSDWADEFARFLRGVDVSAAKDGIQSITTHAVAVVGSSSDGLYPNFVHAIANEGGGQYYAASDVDQLVKALLNIFNSIASVNSVFASATLPISVNTQGSYRNQVFFGMFRPDDSARPRWQGNLKQYQIAYDRITGALTLIDAAKEKAISGGTGFFKPTALSFWTAPSEFWKNAQRGTPPSASDSPDGEVVEKGAAAQQLRTQFDADQSQRKVYTCIACAADTALGDAASTRFEDTNQAITAALLNAANATERTALINWVRGTDNAGDEKGPGGTTTVRPTIHGDVLHSRPAVVDYGGSIGTVVFYGGNDGMLHALNGNPQGDTAGQELWSFVPSEFFGRFKRLRDNLPEVRFPITPPGANATPRDYFVDGAVTVYQKLAADRSTERVIIFVSMRRGGRLLYAFDVTQPGSPRLLWRVSNAELPVLGQTWSEPAVVMVRGRKNAVLVFGAGYDASAEDASPPGTTTMGNAVLILDAIDGSTVATLATDRPVPGGVALMDTDFDGFIDRGYVADLGANVYRIDFESATGESAVSAWRITKFASLNDTVSSRKFFYAPDVVQTKNFTAVLLGSGNRERPLLATSNDRFYTLLDYQAKKGPPTRAPLVEGDLVAAGGTFGYTGSPGCYLALDRAGEKVVTSASSAGGYTYFSTNRPTPIATNACNANLGVAKTYRMALFCGNVESIELAGGGLPPSPVIGMVELEVPGLKPDDPPTTRQLPFIIGGFNPEHSGLAVSRVPVDVDPTRRRTYWFTSREH